MKQLFSLIMWSGCLAVAGFADEPAPAGGLRMIADVHAFPYFQEATYAMNGLSLNGSVFLGWGTDSFTIGGEIWENYLTLDAPTDVYNYSGAWNILRGTATLHLAPTDWLRVKFGLGGGYYRSAFSSDDVGTVGREGAAVSAAADVSVRLVPAVLTAALRNRFDLVFLPEGATPFYYGGFNLAVSPGADWISFYVEAGIQTFLQTGLPREHNTVMFVWGAGVTLAIEFSPAQAETKKVFEERQPIRDEKKAQDKQIEALKTGTEGRIIAFDTIIFYPNSPAIKPESYPVLDQIALILSERQSISLEIRGHTNDLGDAKDEFDLSLKRAEAVRKYLVGKGIALARMKCAGLGSEFSKNLAVAETNRKVEFRILSEK